MLADMRAKVRLGAIEKIRSRHPGEELLKNIPLTTAALKQGASYILDAILEDDLFFLHFDGLKKLEGPSRLGEFHYVPILFHEGEKLRKAHTLLLAFYGLLLSPLQRHMPAHGIIWHGKTFKPTRVRLNADLRKTERLLRDLKEMCGAESPPQLILNSHCQVCEFHTQCHEQALKEDNISLLRGLGEKELKRYARKGILNVTQLAHTFRPRRRGKRAMPNTSHRYIALQALAVRDKRVYVFGTPQLPHAPVHIFLDIEGNPEDGFDYLLGMIVVENDKEQRFSFWADSTDQEERIFEQFLEIVTQYQDFLVFTYGRYERSFLQRMQSNPERRASVDRILKSLVNILSVIYSHVYFPTYSNGLKDVGACLGCIWTEPDSSGIQSLVWRTKWENTRGEMWKNTLIVYNMEDCMALKRVTWFIYAHCAKAMPTLDERPETAVGPLATHVDEVDRLGTVNRRGRKEFFHAEFAYINKCARFDYQRQRVYIRLSKRRKQRGKHRQPDLVGNTKLRATERVEITSRKCPFCGSRDLERPRHAHFGKGCFTKGKKAFDLVFTSGGIKRKVIECRASVHHCLGCDRVFVPARYERLSKHFHGLMSWAMHEHIAHRISSAMVSSMMKEFYGLTVNPGEITRFRPIMAHYYQSTYKNLLRKILASDVLQIDETEVSGHPLITSNSRARCYTL
jgi:predicted RecB family nuclease